MIFWWELSILTFVLSVMLPLGSKVWYFLREGKLNQLFSWPGSPTVERVNFERVWILILILILMCETVLMTLIKYWFGSPSFVNKTQLKCTYMLTELYKLIPFYVLTLQGRILEKDIQARVKVWWIEVLDLVGFAGRTWVEILCNRKKYLWTFRRVM